MDPEIVVYESLAKELIRRCMAEESATDLRQWLQSQLDRLGGGGNEEAALTWPESFEFTDAMLDKFRETAFIPPEQRKELTWPWASWNERIDKMEPGMLGVVTAPDGSGKTIYAESIIEHWARGGHHTVFVHYELNRKLMMLRRLARHTSIEAKDIKAWHLSACQIADIRAVRPLLSSWEGGITYLHTPDWSMERTVAELRKLRTAGQCDVVVLDYLEKASASTRQLKLFGSNLFAREADNVEQLKNFAESTETPVVMIAQMSKAGKGTAFKDMDRTGMRGAGEKSEKANLVVMLHREKIENGYSNDVDVLIDKQTMGQTGTFKQCMRPAFFQVADFA
jgi:replicative DNA helicase